MALKTQFSRRQFTVITAATGMGAFIPTTTPVFAASPTSILWTGVNFIQDCGTGNEVNCEAIDRIFPYLSPSFKDPEKGKFLYYGLPGKWGAAIGKSRQHKLVWMDGENAKEGDDVFQTDLAMMLGITSDRYIASTHYPSRGPGQGKTFMVYELQSYLLVVDVKGFEIVQSYPIRILGIDVVKGDSSPSKLKEDLQKFQWRSLSGRADGKPRVPGELQGLISSLDFNNLKRANVRVTKVLTTKRTKTWINKEHPQPKVDTKTKDLDFKFLLGNSATTAISEKFGIGIQPFTPNASLGLMVEDFAMARGEDTMGEQKLLNTGKIDLDVRLTAKAVVFKNQKKKGYQKTFLKKCTIVVQIEAGRYKRTYDESGQTEQNATLIGKPILKQMLLGVTQEETTGDFSNDWYWAVDLHQRLLDWFFSAIAENKDLSNLTKGQRNRLKAREYLTRVYTKDFAKFEAEANAFKKALLTER